MAAILDPTFRDAVVFFPVATVLHVFEEWPRFPRWARRFASPGYSDREYVITHIAAVAFALLAATLLHLATTPSMVFLFFAFIFGPGIFWNAWFHAGASLLSRTYCAGAITGLLIYIPLSVLLAHCALREGLLEPRALLAAFAVGLIFHTLEVGHNVFKRW